MKKHISLFLIVSMLFSGAVGINANTGSEEMTTQKSDVTKNEDFLSDKEAFSNKYTYDIALQDKLFIEKYPDIFDGALSFKENRDGTASDVSISMYVDEHAAMVEKQELVLYPGKLSVNGTKEYETLIFKDRMLVPADIFSAVGCTVTTDDETRITTITKGENSLEIMPHLLAMRKNGEGGYWVPLEICARYTGDNNTVSVPLRAVGEELGLTVSWNEEMHMAMLKG